MVLFKTFRIPPNHVLMGCCTGKLLKLYPKAKISGVILHITCMLKQNLNTYCNF